MGADGETLKQVSEIILILMGLKTITDVSWDMRKAKNGK